MPNQNNDNQDILAELFDDQPDYPTEFQPPMPTSRANEPIRIVVEPANKQPQPANHWRNERATVGLQSSAIERPRPRKKRFSCLFLVLSLVLLAYLGWRIWPATQSGGAANSQGFSFWKSLSMLTKFKLGVSQRTILKGEDQDRINFVLLGIGGKNHDGGMLTDTIMVASFQPSTHKVVMMSIPRDLTVPMTGYGWRKINSANSLAEAQNPGSGGQATADLISEILEMPIHYYLRVDFDGFVKIIDDLGGIEVEVENTLDDYRYPIMGRENNPDYYSRFEHLHIDAGRQTMDGQLALKYARSRHGVGVEGSDFARSKRQQKILEAVKDKLFSANTLFKPKLIMNIIGNAEEHVTTNLQPDELVSVWQLAKDVNQSQITNIILDNGPKGLLRDVIGTDGAYILTPVTGDFSQIISRFNESFTVAAPSLVDNNSAITKTTATVATISPDNLPNKAEAKLDIRNSTTINGLAGRTKTRLQQYGFTVTNISNTQHKNLAQTTIYDLTYGAKPADLALLQHKTKAIIAADIPQWLATETSQLIKQNPNIAQPDFILLLGLDYSNNP
ncbi:MAG TPA: LCP family protein [bacterium]|jgi:LCP family protein required for cell wall assembly|nr:LCP family protein [bacterium]HNZ51189.1 LCP family protein [bacterium]HOH85084.1 LCP family protein [bacterium]HPX64096.1 LCP family protein [bacterium]HQA83734.1 LCP family protein [bacterium]